jgi:raffinose/stachyose/melibiose transport system substrate-binding protein
MRGSWVSELMNYYSIPNTLYTTRFYYNKDIFRKATGSDKPPKTMREFIEICEKIEKLGVVPVIVENAKGGQGVNFFNTLYSQVAWNVQDEIDYNRDGLISSAEFLRAFTLENYNIDTPMMRALMTLMTDFSKQWGKGFNAIDMTIAPFMFIQEKGACYLGVPGWDAKCWRAASLTLDISPSPLLQRKTRSPANSTVARGVKTIKSPGCPWR